MSANQPFIFDQVKSLYREFQEKQDSPIYVPTQERLEEVSRVMGTWVKALMFEYLDKGMNALNAHRQAVKDITFILSTLASKHSVLVSDVDSILFASILLDKLASQGWVSRDVAFSLLDADISGQIIQSERKSKSRSYKRKPVDDSLSPSSPSSPPLPPLVEWKSVQDFLRQMETKEAPLTSPSLPVIPSLSPVFPLSPLKPSALEPGKGESRLALRNPYEYPTLSFKQAKQAKSSQRL